MGWRERRGSRMGWAGMGISARFAELLAVVALPALGAGSEATKIWFDDPFFQLTHDIVECPEPRGPYITEEEALRESHHRAERGLRCHLEGRCKYSNSYQYDPEIADNIRKAVRDHRMIVPRSTLWVLVQGRRVWIYGCVPGGYRPGALREQLRKIPDIEVATQELRLEAEGRGGYRMRSISTPALPPR